MLTRAQLREVIRQGSYSLSGAKRQLDLYLGWLSLERINLWPMDFLREQGLRIDYFIRIREKWEGQKEIDERFKRLDKVISEKMADFAQQRILDTQATAFRLRSQYKWRDGNEPAPALNLLFQQITGLTNSDIDAKIKGLLSSRNQGPDLKAIEAKFRVETPAQATTPEEQQNSVA